MVRTILIEQFHLSVRAPAGMRDVEYVAIRRTLDDRRFQSDLRQAIRGVLRRYPALNKVRITLSR